MITGGKEGALVYVEVLVEEKVSTAAQVATVVDEYLS